MLIDDDMSMTKLLKTLLEMEGFQVQIVPRGGEALSKAKANPPDIFMVDYNLNDVDGIEVVGHLRNSREFADAPIVMVSGLDVEAEALQNGVDLFILKPFEPTDLVDVF